MGWSEVPIPVFIDTNLGTHLAAPLSPQITAIHFKRELEEMHLNCFPEFGSIKVNTLMVKQRSHCYHLSESLPLEYALKGSNGARFLQMDVDLRSSHVPKKKSRRNRKKARMLKRRDKKDANAEDLSVAHSEPASVSGIIKKYFSDYDEVASTRRSLDSRIECKRSNIREASNERHVKPQVGNRVLLALEDIGLSPSGRRPILSLLRNNVGKSLFHKSTATVGNLVFEMTEESE